MTYLKKKWAELAQKYTNESSLVEEIWSEIQSAYTSETRFYHNLSHIECMIEELDPMKDEISNWDSVLFAVWFHDIIYSTFQFDNEEQSSEYAIATMRKLNVPESIINKSSFLILKTKNHMFVNDPEDLDMQYFLDTDLLVLGKPLEEYKKYMTDIRMEYKNYDNAIYSEGRKMILNKFISMPSIYRTAKFIDKYEQQARINILYEIQNL